MIGNSGEIRPRIVRAVFGSTGPILVVFAITFLLGPSNHAGILAQEDLTAKPPALCDRWHRGAGETTAVDLGQVKAAYRALASSLESRMAGIEAERLDLEGRAWGTAFPACRGGTRLVERLKEPVPRLAGARFYFTSIDDPSRFRLPAAVEKDPDTLVFVLACRRLSDLEAIGRKGRKVQLAAPEFAKALGVRCAGTRVLVSPKGDEIELYEGE
jgi:hypothetical protein